MSENPFKKLRKRLDTLPSGFPATADGTELKILEYLFSPEEAELAAQLKMILETAEEIAERVGGDPADISMTLNSMAMRGLITIWFRRDAPRFRLMPFVVGIYEAQGPRLDAELAELFEQYYLQAFGQTATTEPHLHRVIPVNETIKTDYTIEPYESATTIIEKNRAWAVADCICRKQKSLIGDPCDHPVDVCIWLSRIPGMFDQYPGVRAVSKEEALATLERAADAGLVHSTANSQKSIAYICNCCTCSCGFLRGIADLGIANVMARSAYVSEVDIDLCIGCENCVEHCQFDALSLDGNIIAINGTKCVGCGICVRNCDEEALALVRRPEDEIKPIPVNEEQWGQDRAMHRGIDLSELL